MKRLSPTTRETINVESAGKTVARQTSTTRADLEAKKSKWLRDIGYKGRLGSKEVEVDDRHRLQGQTWQQRSRSGCETSTTRADLEARKSKWLRDIDYQSRLGSKEVEVAARHRLPEHLSR